MSDWHELTATRLTGNHRRRERLVAGMYVEKNGESGRIEVEFSTEPNWNGWPQRFGTSIYPRDFKDLAKFMVEADPQEAIKAFGSALQDFRIPESPEQPPLGARRDVSSITLQSECSPPA